MNKPRIAITCGPNVDKLPPYLKALEAAGAEGVVFQAGQCLADDVFKGADGLLLPGGGDIDPSLYGATPHPTVSNIDRARDLLEKEVLLKAHASGTPILGICRGFQVMGWALGGTLYQDIDAEAPPAGQPKHHKQIPGNDRGFLAHRIVLQPQSRLQAIVECDSAHVNSIHHQGLKTIKAPLVVCATAEDGLIEAVEDPQHPWCIGVEFHPEEILDQGPWKKLFESFVQACR